MEEPTLDTTASPPEEGSNRTFIVVAAVLVGVFVLGLIGIGLFAFVLMPGQKAAALALNATRTANNAATAEQVTVQANLPTDTPLPAPTDTATALPPAVTDTPVVPPTDTPLPAPSDTAPPPTDTLAAPSDTPQAVAQVTDTPTKATGGATGTPTKTIGGATPTTSVSGGSGTASATPTTDTASGAATPTKLPTRTATPGAGGVATATPISGAGGLATPTQLPNTGFADDVGVSNLIIIALALIAIVVIARRLRYSLR